MTDTPITFFLGANTPQGFCGYHQELCNGRDGWRAFLVKGGPGTGKSTLMKRVLTEVTAQGIDAEALCCSSDPGSLDGVVVPFIKTVIVDATAPHSLEPAYWGAVEELVDLSRCMDSDRLHAAYGEIIRLTDACTGSHARCCRYMAAAAALLGDNRRLAAQHTDTDKILRTAARIARREWGRSAGAGQENRRFLSALTPEGWVVLDATLHTLCPRLYVVEDDTGAAASLLLAELRAQALAAGLDIITCTCPLHGSIDHLLIPSLGLGFTTANPYHPIDGPVYRRIHAARFTDDTALRQHREKMAFNRKAAREMLKEAAAAVQQAKDLHDRLERFSQAAMDHEQVERLQKKVIAAFLARIAHQKAEADA